MAKKKPTHQAKQPDPKTQTPSSEADQQTKQDLQAPPSMADNNNAYHHPSSDDDSKEKITNLKSLNAVLLKETVEKRQEISALLESKKSLESELTRSVSEVELLKAELTQMRKEGGEEVEVVKEVVTDFMESQLVGSMRREKEEVEEKLKELEREMEVVVKERDEIEKAKFAGDLEIGSMKKLAKELRDELEWERFSKLDEVSRLKEKIAAVEGRERSVVAEFEGLKSKHDVSMKVVEEKEKEIELMRNESSLLGKECEDLKREIEGLRVEKGTILREKVELCEEIEKMNGKIKEMEDEVDELKGLISSGKVEEEKWRGKYIELQREGDEIFDEFERFKEDFGRLMKEKKEKEEEIKKWMAKLDEINEEVKNLRRDFGKLDDENVRLEGVKMSQEREIFELQNELNEVRVKMVYLQELNRVYAEKIERLGSQINDQENALSRVSVERDELKKGLDAEKKNGADLQAKVCDISKQMEDTAKVMKDLRGLGDTLVAEKKEIEAKYHKLMEDKEIIEKESSLAKGKIDELEKSMKAKTEMFELAVALLRNTVVQLSMDNDKKGGEDEGLKVNERGINGEMAPVKAELEAMRSVFKSREAKVEELHKKMESLESCLVEVKKKKSLWTLISSATTILAAVVSFAYASSSRGS